MSQRVKKRLPGAVKERLVRRETTTRRSSGDDAALRPFESDAADTFPSMSVRLREGAASTAKRMKPGPVYVRHRPIARSLWVVARAERHLQS